MKVQLVSAAENPFEAAKRGKTSCKVPRPLTSSSFKKVVERRDVSGNSGSFGSCSSRNTTENTRMSAIMHLVVENYHEAVVSKQNPIVDTWLFMQSPVPVICILMLYLYFVLKLGPQLMEKRKPFNLKSVLIAYNAYQVIFSAWLCGQTFFMGNVFQIIQQACGTFSDNSSYSVALANGAWWYFFSKIVELLDTVFFVLRKKQSQVTFLHVYHHANLMFFSWVYLKFLPGEQGIFIGLLNSGVHVVMYFYYLIAALGPQYQKYLWWKKYMTWIQLAQFCLMLVYLMSVIAMDCKVPRALTFFFVANVIIFLYLFTDFYRKQYNIKKDMSEINTKHR